MFDDEPIRQSPAHELGMALDALSVEELEARIGQLEAEIDRLRAAIAERGRTRSEADALFKF